MKLIDQEQRDAILKDNSDIVVSASAGSGKTTIMVNKMGIELDKIVNHKTVAAITFTVKASEEIKKKAEKVIKKPFLAMTNDAFIENEIIRPFIKDALGEEFKNDYSVEYDKKYKFQNYSLGLEQLKNDNILGSFTDNKLNFSFKLALSILEKSIAAREYISSKYSWIFIDEYQDSDQDMHRLFMKIKNDLNIKLFIVGDSKQAIYLWRGATKNIFKLLDKEKFNSYELATNFRCDKQIENYANLFHNSKYFVEYANKVSNVILKKYDTFNNYYEQIDFVGFTENFRSIIEKNTLDLDKEIVIIANYNDDAKKITELLNKDGFNFVFIPKTPIDEGIPNGHLLKQLALFLKNSTYSIYDFIGNAHIDQRVSTRLDINNIISGLKSKRNTVYEEVEKVILDLANYLGISITNEEVKKFYESICDSRYDMAFKLIESKHKVMTVFASKGLEFDQVVSFARYYKVYNNEHLENHYVCITRAKERFIMFVDDIYYYQYIVKLANENSIKDVNSIVRFEL